MSLKAEEARRVEQIKERMYMFGFLEKGLYDLREIVVKKKPPVLKAAAAWELALWYANQKTENGARQCLKYIEMIRNNLPGEKNEGLAILEADCFELLNDIKGARRSILSALSSKTNIDLLLAAANLEGSLFAKSMWINKIFKFSELSTIVLNPNFELNPLGKFSSNTVHQKESKETEKVSVIVPIIHAGEEVLPSLNSLLNQTWNNIEIIIVYTGSNTITSILQPLVDKDNRIKLIIEEDVDCSFTLRNVGLKSATGEFVTVHLEGTWSHPEKIELQVSEMVSKPIIANVPHSIHVGNDLRFVRQTTGSYKRIDYASFMFRRKPIMDQLGYWDCVKFGSDEEFISRIQKVFGTDSVAVISTGILSFQYEINNLDRWDNPNGYIMGAKKEYFDSAEYFYKSTKSLYYAFPQEGRHFPVPNPLISSSGENNLHYDFIIASDFRFPGGTSSSNAEEIKAQKGLGRTGLVQISRFSMPPETEMNPKIRELIDGDKVQMVVSGENVSCDTLIIKHPSVLEHFQGYLPKITAKKVFVIINQTPLQKYGSEGKVEYNILNCAKNCEAYFGTTGLWYPISPRVRDILYQHHRSDLEHIPLAEEDWFEIIDIKKWTRTSRPKRGKVAKIGRHSRDQYEKWPSDPEELLAIYPDKGCEVHILGGAEGPIKTLGKSPENWNIIPFGEKHPKDFLKELDVFVYFTHPDLIEAFGRVIIEAMAAGLPVILPYHFKKLFGEAAIYAEPLQVQKKVQDLMDDDKYYERQVKVAIDYVEQHFGYLRHSSRIKV